jgi:hypothetical protein
VRFPGAVTPEQPPQFGQVSDPRIEDLGRADRPGRPATKLLRKLTILIPSGRGARKLGHDDCREVVLEVEAWIFNANAINIAGFVLYGEFCAVLPRRYTTFSIAGV